MERNDTSSPRREFISAMAAGAAAFGLSALLPEVSLGATMAPDPQLASDADMWFEKLKGKKRMVFDVTSPNGNMPFAWPRVFLNTNAATGTPETDQGLVVVLRHNGIPYAMEDKLWDKYKFGEVFKINDHRTKAASIRNPYWKPTPDDYTVPGVGHVAIGINELQDSGVMFCVCDIALTVYANLLAGAADPTSVKKEFLSGLLPNIQVVPAGIWAVGKAQEKHCSYVFAGG